MARTLSASSLRKFNLPSMILGIRVGSEDAGEAPRKVLPEVVGKLDLLLLVAELSHPRG